MRRAEPDGWIMDAIFINHMYLLLSAVTRRFLYLSYSFVAGLCLIVTIVDVYSTHDVFVIVIPQSIEVAPK